MYAHRCFNVFFCSLFLFVVESIEGVCGGVRGGGVCVPQAFYFSQVSVLAPVAGVWR